MLSYEIISDLLKIFISSAIFFVWVIRYQNIIEEFKDYDYPNWLRDLVGILKISFAIMLFMSNESLVQIGSLGIAALMLAALVTHVKVKNPGHKMLPSFTLLCFSLFVCFG